MKRFDISGYLEDRLDKFRLCAGKSGAEITAACPVCGRYGGFYANTESGAFVCFKCDWRGRGVVPLVAQLEGCDEHAARAYVFRNAVEFRRRTDIVSLTDRIAALRPHSMKEEERALINAELPAGFRPVYAKGCWSYPSYLRKRGIRPATARAWGLGFCRNSRVELPGRDRPMWLCHRLIIPIVCPAGRSWTARDMTGQASQKYLNPAVDHRKLLIGWNMARLTGDLVICEGPLDVIKLWQHKIAAVALGGKMLSDEQFGLLTNLPRELAVTVMLDPEEKQGAIEVAKRLTLHFREVYVAELPEGIDPGDSSGTEAYEAVDAAWRFRGHRVVSLRAAMDRARSGWSSHFHR